jgi:hypothetical protein
MDLGIAAGYKIDGGASMNEVAISWSRSIQCVFFSSVSERDAIDPFAGRQHRRIMDMDIEKLQRPHLSIICRLCIFR